MAIQTHEHLLQAAKTVTSTLAAVVTLALPLVADAHPTHDGMEVPLHVVDGSSYSNCFFDLHPELTQKEFDTFAGEAGAILRFHQDASAETLGKWNIDVGLAMTRSPIDDSKGAWNNTMSHPDAEHYLGHDVSFPRLVIRLGVAERVDVGVWGSLDPNSNFGFVGMESKISVLRQDEETPVSIAVRPNASALLGPDEVFVANASVDVSVSRNWRGLSPYLGVAATTSVAVERSEDVDLDNGTNLGVLAFAGLAYQWENLRVATEAEAGELTTASLLVGGTF